MSDQYQCSNCSADIPDPQTVTCCPKCQAAGRILKEDPDAIFADIRKQLAKHWEWMAEYEARVAKDRVSPSWVALLPYIVLGAIAIASLIMQSTM